MGAEIVNVSKDLLTLEVTGRLTEPELSDAQKKAADILRQQGKKHLLIIIRDFQGWGKGDWGDLSGQQAVESYIDRIAIVGDKKWEALALLFTGKGIRRTPIKYFSPADLPNAQAWLAKASSRPDS
jgi:hypothetical protein